ncbi:putative RAB-interacting protein [Trypanosoma grayi]|uniref:putative RAB-interacting protein n=1 Tax=Trypanosoma grayi TaxID=71804 RepID=UPI0004F4929A|nr:putative RAB-interacting protein [Trypanosoma grayi]KEG12106.1 putative RAB-interacting protein [Trypanosoma grayi]
MPNRNTSAVLNGVAVRQDAGPSGNCTLSSSGMCSSDTATTHDSISRELSFPSKSSSDTSSKEEQQQRHCGGVRGYVHYAMQQMWCIRETLQKEQLPWKKDFFNYKQFFMPKSSSEAIERLNLNLPFYGANYAVVFYSATLPFLLLYDPVFFVLLLVSAILVHSIHLHEKKRAKCGANMCIGGVSILYQNLVDVYIIILWILFFFRDGLRTLGLVLLLNSILILPHALWRRPTYFDDEELEKLRPKTVQYIITLVLLVLAYLECKGAGGKSGVVQQEMEAVTEDISIVMKQDQQQQQKQCHHLWKPPFKENESPLPNIPLR